jgi:cell division topological specificity factor
MTSLLKALFFGSRTQTSAAVAKDRLQLIIARERNGKSDAPDFLPQLQRELLEVVAKYAKVEPDSIKVEMDRSENLELLAINIVLPDMPQTAATV